jgi:DNA-binding NarL/FixJ family response regulator
MGKIKIMIVDDHKVVREGTKTIFYGLDHFSIIGEAANSKQLFSILETDLIPDILILDIALPDESGIVITERLSVNFPSIKVIMFTAHTNESYIFDALQAGAKGFLSKDTEEDELIKSILEVYNGKNFLSGKISSNLLMEYFIKQKNDAKEAKDNLDSLTKRELEIITLIAEGLTSKEIARKLNISHKTVETHRVTIFQKLELKSVVDLVKFAIRKNIITL